MFNTIYNLFYRLITYLYSFVYGKTETKKKEIEIKETESEYVYRKLNIWKVDMFSKNSYLAYIPDKRIHNKELEFKKEYLENSKS
jgi:hypothetical protein